MAQYWYLASQKHTDILRYSSSLQGGNTEDCVGKRRALHTSKPTGARVLRPVARAQCPVLATRRGSTSR